jgi:enoyl-CoA hydratase/carnithine racemase
MATITVGTGDRHNVLTTASWRQLARMCRQLAAMTALRAVVIVGAGGTFSAGSDLREWVNADVEGVDESFDAMEAAFAALESVPVPSIAAVRGIAAGGGCQLALAADLRFVSDDALMGMPILKFGIQPPPSFVARLIQAVGPGAAHDLLYTGRLMPAPEAVRAGLASRQVPAAELDAATREAADTIVSLPPTVVRAAKRDFASVMHWFGEADPSAMVSHVVDGDHFHRAIRQFLARSEARMRARSRPHNV